MEIQACVEGEVEGGQEKEHGQGEGAPLSGGMVRGPEENFQNLFASNQGGVHGDGDDSP